MFIFGFYAKSFCSRIENWINLLSSGIIATEGFELRHQSVRTILFIFCSTQLNWMAIEHRESFRSKPQIISFNFWDPCVEIRRLFCRGWSFFASISPRMAADKGHYVWILWIWREFTLWCDCRLICEDRDVDYITVLMKKCSPNMNARKYEPQSRSVHVHILCRHGLVQGFGFPWSFIPPTTIDRVSYERCFFIEWSHR